MRVTVSSLIQMFRDRLVGLYPPGEIESFIGLVFEAYLQYGKSDLIIHSDRRLHPFVRHVFDAAISSLERYEPIQYVLGRTNFYGLEMEVDQRVLIPRPETEELVKWILDDTGSEASRMLDIGTGSGCIAIALKKQRPNIEMHAVDSSSEALDLAATNARFHQTPVNFFIHDLLKDESMNFMKFDLMVSNPPYIAEGEKAEMDINVTAHEPHAALFVPDEDPLLFYRRIVDLADGHLNKGGKLYFETHETHGIDVAGLLQDRGYLHVALRKDINGKDRMVKAVKA